MTNSTDFYSLYEIAPNASDRTIKAAHKTQINKYHPDKHKGDNAEAHRMTILINEAKNVLLNARKRALHDKKIGLHSGQNKDSASSKSKFEENFFNGLMKAAEKAKMELERDAKKAELDRHKAACERNQAEQLRKEAEEIKKNIEKESDTEKAIKAENLKQAYKAKLKEELQHKTNNSNQADKKNTSILTKIFIFLPLLMLSIIAFIFSVFFILSRADSAFDYVVISLFTFAIFKLMQLSYRRLLDENTLQGAV
ncbi:MAG: curved DNA-binding protein CbpA [Psychroserpens sp.]|jgi:curved DNA-binding protein CbpA